MRASVTLTVGLLFTLSCQRAAMLEANNQTMRTVLERRSEYAKSSPDHVDFPRYFDRGFVDGVELWPVEVGTLESPTGQLEVSDPFYLGSDITYPLERSIPPGRYPVVLTVADLGPWGDRVAFANLRITDEPVASWVLANTTEDSGINVFFGVDAGMACFVDSAAAEVFAKTLKDFTTKHPDGNYYDDVLSRDIPANANWGVHAPSRDSRLNLIVFSTGLGDGLYSAYWGLTASGNVSQLVIDFQLFDEQGTIVRRG